jgi:hypothetical protein
VAEVTDDAEMIAAAWLHDTVEDTPATFGDIEREFGAEVRALVADLTDVSKPSDGNRAVRKAIDRHHTAQASVRAKTVKLADLIDNCRDICEHDASFGGSISARPPRCWTCSTRATRRCSGARRRCSRPAPSGSACRSRRRAWTRTRPGGPSRVGSMSRTCRSGGCSASSPAPSPPRDRPAAALVRRRAPGGGSCVEQLRAAELEVAGLRQRGVCVGYLRRTSRRTGRRRTLLRAFTPAQVLRGEAALSEVVRVLTRYDFCFVTAMGDVAGVITRGDMQSPIVRMWLFGIITFMELELLERIRARWPDGSWTGCCPRAG